MMQALRLTTQQKLVWLTLLVLFSVNTVLVWHSVAHAQRSVVAQQSNSSPNTSIPLDQHCDLCLSAHGLSAGTLSQFVLYLASLLAVFVITPNAVLAPTLTPYRLKARAPPVPLV